ncbi:MAG: cell wall hydrolase [Lysobacter sp.]|nr:cell wall hydrolase [Lysobacter sp.]
MLIASNPATAAPIGAAAPAVQASTTTTTTSAPAQATTTAAPAAKVAYLADGTKVEVAAPKVAYLPNGTAVRVATPASVIAQAPLMMSRNLPLYALVATYVAGAALDQQAQCLAITVYHEARGETLEGQLAVANVVINRARSGRYPPSWCEVMKQPWQFSFVNPRTGDYPGIDTASAAWSKAQAIARIAAQNVAAEVDQDVLWYHADYVAPSWGRRLTRGEKIGTHIFYRA